MNFIKSWFIDGTNKTGCRFIVVDFYNEMRPLRYYSNYGFISLFTSENKEKEYTSLNELAELKNKIDVF